MKYYYGTKKNLLKTFIVKSRVSKTSQRTMNWEYGIRDIKNGIFVTDYAEYAKVYGPKVYEIIPSEEPFMVNNGIYFIPNGVKVKAKRIV